MPFEPGVSDHFSLVGITAPSVDISFYLQPGGSPLERIPILLDIEKMSIDQRYAGLYQLKYPNNESPDYRVVGPLPTVR